MAEPSRRDQATMAPPTMASGAMTPGTMALGAMTPSTMVRAALDPIYAASDVSFSRRGLGTGALVALSVAALATAVEGATLSAVSLVIGPVLLVAAALAIAASAVRRRATQLKAAEAEAFSWEAAAALKDQYKLLQFITDNQPAGIAIIGSDGRYRFANRVAAQRAGCMQDDMAGDTMEAVLGLRRAARYQAANRAALDSGIIQSRWTRAEDAAGERVLLSDHIPLNLGAESAPDILVVERDVTPEVAERERRERTLDRMVATLIGAVDQRDPYAAHHAAQVGDLAERIAEEMGLDETVLETAWTAGSLMTVGKILVPEIMLTHGNALLPQERRQARASLQATVELLEGLEFNGPVVKTLSQLQERVDGQGAPLGLAGEEILISARILKAANSFLGLISRRPGSPGLTMDEALNELRHQAGSAYDRDVIATLTDYLQECERTAWHTGTRPTNHRSPPY